MVLLIDVLYSCELSSRSTRDGYIPVETTMAFYFHGSLLMRDIKHFPSQSQSPPQSIHTTHTQACLFVGPWRWLGASFYKVLGSSSLQALISFTQKRLFRFAKTENEFLARLNAIFAVAGLIQ